MALQPEPIDQLLFRTLARGLTRRWPRRALLQQIHEIGNQSVLLVVGGMIFFGAVMVAHGAFQARKVVGDLSIVGPGYMELMVAELGPTIAGVLAAVRAGAAISAELAAMRVTEQLDALEMCAGDPYSDLVAPRLLAGIIAVPSLIIAGTMGALLSAAVVATFVYGADGWSFLNPALVDRSDVTSFFGKSFLYGAAIPLAACRAGLSARGGPGAVGEATTAGVVAASVAVIVLDLAAGAVLYLAH